MKKKYIFISLILVGAIAFAYSQKDLLFGFIRGDFLSDADKSFSEITSVDTAEDAATAAAAQAEIALEAMEHAEMMYGTLRYEDRFDQATAQLASIVEDATTADQAATRAEALAVQAAELTELAADGMDFYERSVAATEEAVASAEAARAYSDATQRTLELAQEITIVEEPDYGLVLLQIEDAYGNLITGLSETDFTISGADDTLYTFETWGDGYLLTLIEDENYTIEIHPDGYVSDSIDAIPSGVVAGEGELIQLDYAYTVKVYDGENYLDESDVYAGDLSTECEVVYDDSDDPIYACMVPLSETEYKYKVETSGYDDIEGSFDSDRTSNSDDAENISVSLEDSEEETDIEDVSSGVSDAEKSLDDGTDLSDSIDEEEDTSEEVVEDTEEEVADDTSDAKRECSDAFSDTEGHWAEDAICLLYQKEIVEGRREGYYVPDDYVTKAEFLKMVLLSNSFEVDYDLDVDTYSDVNAGDWYYYYVALADSMKDLWFSGNGTWSPNSDITRGDAILLIVRLSDKTLYGYDAGDLIFTDVDLENYQTYAIILGEQYGVIEGYEGTDEFRPDNKITRAEAAIMTIRSANLFE